MNSSELRLWDNEHVWHPFTAMQAHRTDEAPIIVAGDGFDLIDVDGRRYLDGVSSLWCNVHGHRVPQIDQAIREQLDRIGHSTLLGLANEPSIRLAKALVDRAPRGLTKVFYSDSGATAVEAALKIAYQYHRQKSPQSEPRDLFVSLDQGYHGDTIGSVSLSSMSVFHATYRDLLFQKLTVPAPGGLRVPAGFTCETYIAHCFAEMERIVAENHRRIVAFVIEPLVQGAAGVLVHPDGYLRRVREVTHAFNVPLIADEVAVGFGRTGSLFACEQESVCPDILCLAKGLTAGYLPLAATLTTDEIFNAFLGDPWAGRTFYHGHTYTGNPLGCAAALASLELFDTNRVLGNVAEGAQRLRTRLSEFAGRSRVIGEVRQRGLMIGIELVKDRDSLEPFATDMRIGHQVALAARRRGVFLRPIGDVVILMPAPAMPVALIDRLCDVTFEAIDEVAALTERHPHDRRSDPPLLLRDW